jgi:hypothetical protein
MWHSRPSVLQLNCGCFSVAMRSLSERETVHVSEHEDKQKQRARGSREQERNIKLEITFASADRIWKELKCATSWPHKTGELQNTFWRKNTHTHTRTRVRAHTQNHRRFIKSKQTGQRSGNVKEAAGTMDKEGQCGRSCHERYALLRCYAASCQ